jgi:hypothetical protein
MFVFFKYLYSWKIEAFMNMWLSKIMHVNNWLLISKVAYYKYSELSKNLFYEVCTVYKIILMKLFNL